jgi:hypothetical protein
MRSIAVGQRPTAERHDRRAPDRRSGHLEAAHRLAGRQPGGCQEQRDCEVLEHQDPEPVGLVVGEALQVNSAGEIRCW